MKNYYFAVYVDHNKTEGNTRIAQISDCVNALSCEILAKPGCVNFQRGDDAGAIEAGKKMGKLSDCKFLEIQLNNYDLIELT